MKTCRTVRTFLPDYIDGTLNEQESLHVADHVAHCRTCATQIEELKTLFAGLDLVEVSPPSHAYWSSLLPKIHQRLDGKTSPAIPQWVSRLVLPAAAAAVLSIVTLRLVPTGSFPESDNVQSIIQQLQPAELQELDDRESIGSYIEASDASVDRTLAVDADLLQDILQREDHRAVYDGLDPSAAYETMTDQTEQELISIMKSVASN